MATKVTSLIAERDGSLDARVDEQIERYKTKRPPEGFRPFPKIPMGRYTDQAFYDLEQEHLWKKSWNYAAHLDELPEVGSYLTWDLLGVPLFLLRGKDNRVRAFYNSCPHRGSALIMEDSGKRSGLLVCPFHAWSFNDTGNLVKVPAEHEFGGIDREKNCLKQVRCELAGNLIFVNLDPQAPSLRDWIGASFFDEFCESADVGKGSFLTKYYTEVNVNWKVAVATFIEVYHIPVLHSRSVPMSSVGPAGSFLSLCYPNGNTRLRPSLSPSLRPQYQSGEQNAADVSAASKEERLASKIYGTYNLFPTFLCSIADNCWLAVNCWPTAVDKTIYEVVFVANLEKTTEDYRRDWEKQQRVVIGEDFWILAKYDKAIRSGAIDGIQLGLEEACVYHFEEHVDRVIGVDRIPENLRVEPGYAKVEGVD